MKKHKAFFGIVNNIYTLIDIKHIIICVNSTEIVQYIKQA